MMEEQKLHMCGMKCLNVGRSGRLQSYTGSRMSKWTLNTVHAEATASSPVPFFSEKICTQEDDQLKAASQQGFPSPLETSSLKSN